MGSTEELMQRLAVSKKIMERSEQIKAGGSDNRKINIPAVEEFSPVNATYNLPSEFLPEQTQRQSSFDPTQPIEEGRILKSKLPDEIKRLMMEHPIQQPTMGMSTGTVLSDDLVERAARLMNTNAKGDQVLESRSKKTTQPQQTQPSTSLTANQIKNIVKETVEDVLKENGLLVESESNSGEIFKFRVGQHIFEGKVLKVKKIAK